MEVTKQMWENAVRATRHVAIEMTKVSTEAAPLVGQKSDFGLTLRNQVALLVAFAFYRNTGDEGVNKAIGKNTLKVAASVLKSRLTEANKVRRLHPEWSLIAEHWANQRFGGKDETGEVMLPGVSVAEALKHPVVARPRDTFAALGKGVKIAVTYGATLEDVLEAASRAFAESEGADVDAVPEEAEVAA